MWGLMTEKEARLFDKMLITIVLFAVYGIISSFIDLINLIIWMYFHIRIV